MGIEHSPAFRTLGSIIVKIHLHESGFRMLVENCACPTIGAVVIEIAIPEKQFSIIAYIPQHGPSSGGLVNGLCIVRILGTVRRIRISMMHA